jgi:hypothetical protein
MSSSMVTKTWSNVSYIWIFNLIDFGCCWISNYKNIFSLVGILTNLRKCRLQIENLEKLIFVNKNWPNDPRIGCKSPSNLVEFLEKNVDLEEELKEFEGEFERDEVVEV